MSRKMLILGAGPGIGLATARRFGQEGYHVVLASRNTARLQGLAAQLEAEGLSASVEQVDVSDVQSIAGLVQRIGDDLSVLHYNAGVLHYDAEGQLQARPLQAETPASLVSDTQVNLIGAMAAIQAALPALSNTTGASVLLTGGGFGVQPSADFLTLSVGKAGLRAVALALFEPLKQQRVHVSTVTVSRLVEAESPEAGAVAEAFWALHAQPEGQWTVETVYS